MGVGQPDQWDDPLALDEPVLHNATPTGLVLTGLSDEDDAERAIIRTFNEDLLYCPNCEVHQLRRAKFDNDCDRCGLALMDKDARPSHYKTKFR